MATTTTATPKNRTYPIVKTLAYGAFGAGLALSVSHTYSWFRHDLGASTINAAFVPLFVDGLQITGRLIRGPQFARNVRRAGWALQIFGAALALTANILAGHTIGDKASGAIFVLGYILFDVIAEVIRPASDDVEVKQAAAKAAQTAARSAAARKAAATRTANKAEADRKAIERKERAKLSRLNRVAEVDALNASFQLPAAPVSPAPVDYENAAYL